MWQIIRYLIRKEKDVYWSQAIKPAERLSQHSKHTSSNYLMNLTEATFMVLFQGKYRISQYVITKIVHHSHAIYGEIIFSRSALAYTTQGGGFSHCMAGSSNAGVDTFTQTYWTGLRNSLFSDSSFLAKLEAEVKKEKAREHMLTSPEVITAAQDEVFRSSIRVGVAPKICDETSKEGRRQVQACLTESEPWIEFLELEDDDGDIIMEDQ